MSANKFGIQTQRGDPPDYTQMDWSRIAVAKFLGNGLNHDMIKHVRDVSPNTFIILRANVGDWYVDKAWTMQAANVAAFELESYLRAGLCDAVESPNEPVVQTVEAAKLLNESMVAWAEFMHARGYANVIAYNFSIGNPDYALWPHLLDGARASEFIGLHQYGFSYPPFTLQAEATDYSLRHRKVLQLLPADARRKFIFTECGVDTRNGGYKRAPFTFAQYAEMLKWWLGELASDESVAGCALFGAGMLGKWVELGFDVLDNEDDRAQFYSFVRGLEPVQKKITAGVIAPVISPPAVVPPQPTGGSMTIEQQRSDEGFKAAGVAYNKDAALFKFAQAHGLGYPVTNEYPVVRDGAPHTAQGYRDAIIEVKVNDWGNVKAYDWLTGMPWAPTAGGGGGAPTDLPGLAVALAPLVAAIIGTGSAAPLAYSFPKTLSDIGAFGEQGQPVAGQPFYRLSGAAVTRGVSALMVVTVLKKDRSPAVGAKVMNTFPDGNGEVLVCDGSGNARMQFGASSAFTQPGAGPFTVCVVDDSAVKDFDSVPKRINFKARLSDVVKSLGDFQGQHTEIYLQFIEQ